MEYVTRVEMVNHLISRRRDSTLTLIGEDSLKPNIQISPRKPLDKIKKRESPSMAKGVRLRLLSLRGSWVQIPSPALAYAKLRVGLPW